MKKLLIIEDNPEIRENTAEILELAGYEVLTAENGRVGAESAVANLPDLIICDIMMPELDGYEVLSILSKNPKTASIPFIFLTAKAEKTDFRKGMNMGADDYLTKPFEELDLLNTIERRLQKLARIQAHAPNDSADKLTHFFNQTKGIQHLEALSDEREIIHYKPKQLLFAEGAYPHKIFYVKSGKIKSYRTNEMGKELIINVFQKGDFIGYQAVLENKPYAETAMSIEESEVAIVPKDDFFTLLYNDKDVAHQFIKMLSNNLSEKEERLLQLAYNSVRRRLADTLLTLLQKQEPEQDLKISRENLASFAGTSKETIIRCLSDFKSEGLIEVKQNTIKVLNLEKLRYIIG